MTPQSAIRNPQSVIWLVGFLLAAACGGPATVPPSPTALSVPSATVAPTATLTALPSREFRPPVLITVRVDQAPVADGLVESVWEAAPALTLPLAQRREGATAVGEVTLQSVHHRGWVYFLARWSEDSPGGEPGPWVSNKFTVIWHGALASKAPRDCATVCHTAYTVTQQEIDVVRPVSIPAGDESSFDGRGLWQDGRWTLEWRRKLITDHPLDVQFDDPTAAYVFQVAVTSGQDGEISLVSPWAELRFSPPGE